MNPNFNNLNHNLINPNMNDMMNNFNNINNMMMNLPNDNMNPNIKQQILNLINQNIQMTELISMNNKMIKEMIENSDFGNNNKEKDVPLKNFLDIDFFPEYDGQRVNAIFSNTKGYKINIITPLKAKVKDLINAFHITLQIYGKYVMKTNILKIKDYTFIWNGSIIPINEQKTLSEYGMIQNVINIVFNEKNNIIGG
jgi:hypothetical protein